MTVFGSGLLGIIVFSLYISYKITRRASKKNNILIFIFMSLILLCINGISYIFSADSIEHSCSLIFDNKYRATIIDYEVSEGITTPTGSISKTQQKMYYYNAIVRYKDKNGEYVKKSIAHGTDEPPLIGTMVIISNRPHEDKIIDLSFAKNPIILFSYLFTSILISLSFFLTCYGFGVENCKNRKNAKKCFFICIIAGLCLYVTNLIIVANTQ